MTDDTRELQLTHDLRAFAEGGVRRVDRRAVAEAAIAQGRHRGVVRGLLMDGLTGPAARPWSAVSSPAVRFAVVILLLLALATAALVAGGLNRSNPGPRGPFPLVDNLGAFETRSVSAFGGARLSDGRVLLAGGVDTTVGQTTLRDAWLFNPATRDIAPTGAMASSRANPMLVTLADGRVLVLGGWFDGGGDGDQPREGAELYDPATGAFRATADPPFVRRSCPCGALARLPWAIPVATLLDDGRVLVTGGAATVATVASLFDPGSETWNEVDIGCDASRGTQTKLADGRVLVLCVIDSADRSGPVETRARLFAPTTSSFAEGGVPTTLARHAIRLADGSVLFTGFSAMRFDPTMNAFTAMRLGNAVQTQVPVDIGDGRVLFLGFGGPPNEDEPASYVLDPATQSLSIVTPPEFSVADAVVPLADGRLLTVGFRLEARLLDPTQLP